jgi:hypothetical protein
VARIKAEQHLKRFKTCHLAPKKPGKTLPQGDLTREEILHAYEIRIVEIGRDEAIEVDDDSEVELGKAVALAKNLRDKKVAKRKAMQKARDAAYTG